MISNSSKSGVLWFLTPVNLACYDFYLHSCGCQILSERHAISWPCFTNHKQMCMGSNDVYGKVFFFFFFFASQTVDFAFSYLIRTWLVSQGRKKDFISLWVSFFSFLLRKKWLCGWCDSLKKSTCVGRGFIRSLQMKSSVRHKATSQLATPSTLLKLSKTTGVSLQKSLL